MVVHSIVRPVVPALVGSVVNGPWGSSAVSLPQDGLVASWLFTEGAGTTVADASGNGNTLDLEAQGTAPYPAWNANGVDLSNGGGAALKTPALNHRTVVAMWRPKKDGTGFWFSGPDLANDGLIGNNAEGAAGTQKYHIGQGFGVAEMRDRRPDAANGLYPMSTGGWRVFFWEHEEDKVSKSVTANGRQSGPDTREDEGEVGFMAMYDRQLTDADRTQIYSYCRGLARARGINLHFADLESPTIDADFLLLGGASNADGRASVSAMSAGDQARTYSNGKLILNASAVLDKTWQTPVIGANINNGNNIYFGAELTLFNLRQDNPTGRDLYIFKPARGSSYLAPSTDPNVVGGHATFNEDESVTSSIYHQGLLWGLYYAISDALENGIKLNYRGMIWNLGTNDALFTSTANAHGAALTDFFNALEADSALPISGNPLMVTRVQDTSGANPSALATVRADLTAFAASNANYTLIDVDGYTLIDTVHYDAASMLNNFGLECYNNIFGTSLTYTPA